MEMVSIPLAIAWAASWCHRVVDDRKSFNVTNLLSVIHEKKNGSNDPPAHAAALHIPRCDLTA